MGRALHTRRKVLGQLLDHARRQPHRECCGLLAGRDGAITMALPAENVAADPKKSYEIAPAQTIGLMRELRERGLGFLGIYHSHPSSENVPSQRDIALAYYSDAAYFIITPRPYAEKPVRAFSIREGRVAELDLQILAD